MRAPAESGAQLHAVGLQEKLNAVFEFVDSADYAPARQASQVLDELTPKLDAVVARFELEVQPKVNEFNEVVRAAGLGALVGR